MARKIAGFSVLTTAALDCNMQLPVQLPALVPGAEVVTHSRFKKPATVDLPEGSYVKGRYVYTPEINGKARWFKLDMVEMHRAKSGRGLSLTTEAKLLVARGMVAA